MKIGKDSARIVQQYRRVTAGRREPSSGAVSGGIASSDTVLEGDDRSVSNVVSGLITQRILDLLPSGDGALDDKSSSLTPLKNKIIMRTEAHGVMKSAAGGVPGQLSGSNDALRHVRALLRTDKYRVPADKSIPGDLKKHTEVALIARQFALDPKNPKVGSKEYLGALQQYVIEVWPSKGGDSKDKPPTQRSIANFCALNEGQRERVYASLSKRLTAMKPRLQTIDNKGDKRRYVIGDPKSQSLNDLGIDLLNSTVRWIKNPDQLSTTTVTGKGSSGERASPNTAMSSSQEANKLLRLSSVVPDIEYRVLKGDMTVGSLVATLESMRAQGNAVGFANTTRELKDHILRVTPIVTAKVLAERVPGEIGDVGEVIQQAVIQGESTQDYMKTRIHSSIERGDDDDLQRTLLLATDIPNGTSASRNPKVCNAIVDLVRSDSEYYAKVASTLNDMQNSSASLSANQGNNISSLSAVINNVVASRTNAPVGNIGVRKNEGTDLGNQYARYQLLQEDPVRYLQNMMDVQLSGQLRQDLVSSFMSEVTGNPDIVTPEAGEYIEKTLSGREISDGNRELLWKIGSFTQHLKQEKSEGRNMRLLSERTGDVGINELLGGDAKGQDATYMDFDKLLEGYHMNAREGMLMNNVAVEKFRVDISDAFAKKGKGDQAEDRVYVLRMLANTPSGTEFLVRNREGKKEVVDKQRAWKEVVDNVLAPDNMVEMEELFKVAAEHVTLGWLKRQYNSSNAPKGTTYDDLLKVLSPLYRCIDGMHEIHEQGKLGDTSDSLSTSMLNKLPPGVWGKVKNNVMDDIAAYTHSHADVGEMRDCFARSNNMLEKRAVYRIMDGGRLHIPADSVLHSRDSPEKRTLMRNMVRDIIQNNSRGTAYTIDGKRAASAAQLLQYMVDECNKHPTLILQCLNALLEHNIEPIDQKVEEQHSLRAQKLHTVLLGMRGAIREKQQEIYGEVSNVLPGNIEDKFVADVSKYVLDDRIDKEAVESAHSTAFNNRSKPQVTVAGKGVVHLPGVGMRSYEMTAIPTVLGESSFVIAPHCLLDEKTRAEYQEGFNSALQAARAQERQEEIKERRKIEKVEERMDTLEAKDSGVQMSDEVLAFHSNRLKRSSKYNELMGAKQIVEKKNVERPVDTSVKTQAAEEKLNSKKKNVVGRIKRGGRAWFGGSSAKESKQSADTVRSEDKIQSSSDKRGQNTGTQGVAAKNKKTFFPKFKVGLGALKPKKDEGVSDRNQHVESMEPRMGNLLDDIEMQPINRLGAPEFMHNNDSELDRFFDFDDDISSTVSFSPGHKPVVLASDGAVNLQNVQLVSNKQDKVANGGLVGKINTMKDRKSGGVGPVRS